VKSDVVNPQIMVGLRSLPECYRAGGG